MISRNYIIPTPNTKRKKEIKDLIEDKKHTYVHIPREIREKIPIWKDVYNKKKRKKEET